MTYQFPRDPFPGADTEILHTPSDRELWLTSGNSRPVRRRLAHRKPWYQDIAEKLFWICILTSEIVWIALIVLIVLALVRHR